MDRRIEVKVFGNHLWKDGNRAGVQGEGNVTTLRISFDEGWSGYAKRVTFFNAKGRNPVTRILTADLLENEAESALVYLCKIPPEPLAEAGWCSFIVDGYIEDERQRSVETQLEVVPARETTGAVDPGAPTPTQAEQLQTQIEAVADDIQTAAQASRAVLGMTVSTQTLEAGQNAAVEKTENDDGGISLHFSIPRGEKGEKGERGEQGNGIVNITCVGFETATNSDGRVTKRSATYRILFDDGRTYDFTVEGGADGKTGDKGAAGFSPIVYTDDSVDDDGRTIHEIMFRTASGMVTTEVRDGLDGQKGVPGAKGDPFTYEDFTPEQLASIKDGVVQGAIDEAREYAEMASLANADSEEAATRAEAAQAAAERAAENAQQAAGSGDMQMSVYDPAGLKKDIFRYVGEMAAETLTDAQAYADELLEGTSGSGGAGVFECYLDQTEFWEVNDAYQNGSIVVMWDNCELWPMVYADTDNEYRFRIVDPDGIRTAYLTEDGWSNSYDAFSTGGSTYAMARIGEVTLPASAWVSKGSLHSQVVEIEGVTEYSQVDLTPSVEQLAVFYEKDLTFVTENEDGVVTVYAIGQKPTNDYTIQVTITEVEV